VAEDQYRQCLGCAAVYAYSKKLGEIVSVAVLPEFQRQGIGERLIKECLRQAKTRGLKRLFLATAKPSYFARFDFRPVSRRQLPISVLLRNVRQVLEQPPQRWWPALFGRFQFMQNIIGA
jgi:N-acetylglutamate synthase-like GNAT family acetyltransferase